MSSNNPQTDVTNNHANQIQYDVVVVGLGPTGATLVNLLAQRGLTVLAIEKEQSIYPFPRAVHLDDEVMRVFDSCGIAESIEPKLFVNKGMRFCSKKGEVLLDWPRPQEISQNGWHASYRFHQPDVETALRESLKKYANVAVKLATTVTGIIEGDLFATVEMQLGNSMQTVQARYVVGCDGANSMVKRHMQVKTQSLGFQQRWLVVDVVLKKPLPELGDYTIQYCDDVRPTTYCRNVGLRRRWEFALHDEESGEMADSENCWSLLSAYINPDDAEIERTAIYTFKSTMATSWVKNRCALAGDAAHLMPPFMGQGMCAGIRDAANLAWKLSACCLQGEPSSLLRTYESERTHNVQQFIEKSVELGELINLIRQSNNANANADANHTPVMKSLQLRLGNGLGSSKDKYRGLLFPNLLLNDGQTIDQVSGYEPFIAVVDSVDPSVYSSAVFQSKAINDYLLGAGVLAMSVRADKYILSSQI